MKSRPDFALLLPASILLGAGTRGTQGEEGCRALVKLRAGRG